MKSTGADFVGEWENPEPEDDGRDPLDLAASYVRGIRSYARLLEGEPGEVIELAIRTAQRAFDEIGACNAVLDHASDRSAAPAPAGRTGRCAPSMPTLGRVSRAGVS
ncbi:hypothetical protein NLX86_09845 [Streptomyces sp. A3M-1-3]|uniref:hypothetical protein n=1 Tax=Streptomyces sp. A3M-1-3 TaxID=2962044 RepID=UPI0020B73CB4|nr:hypothetical protein [Streptomyces sp. A3M-1-3]MCP3818406.1 hypothetical protein [Streptomyces sp. A3M-1-3]